MNKRPTKTEVINLGISAVKEAVIIGFKIFVVSYIAILVFQNIKL